MSQDPLLRRLLEQVKFPEEKLDRMIGLLTEIRNLLTVAPPPAGAVTLANLDEVKAMILEAIEEHAVLKRANDLYVATISLATARTTPTEITELAPSGAIALTIFRTTGTFTLYLQKADDVHKITFDALTFPQTFLLDFFDLKKVYITNAADLGKEATIIVWKKT